MIYREGKREVSFTHFIAKGSYSEKNLLTLLSQTTLLQALYFNTKSGMLSNSLSTQIATSFNRKLNRQIGHGISNFVIQALTLKFS
jgi:hypothetical protein